MKETDANEITIYGFARRLERTVRGSLNSVTRFGKISQVWQNSKRLGHFSESLSSIWQNFEPTLANLYTIGRICIVVNGQILIKN